MNNLSAINFDTHVAAAVSAPEMAITHLELNLFPVLVPGFKPQPYHPYRRAAGYVARVTNHGGCDHTVCVALYDTDSDAVWSFWCGNKFHEKGNGSVPTALTVSDGRAMCEFATQDLPNSADVITRMMSQFQQYTRSAPCDFWNDWRRKQKACAHVQTVLAHLRDNVPDFRTRMRELLDEVHGAASINA